MRAAELASSQEISVLLLTAFTERPKICFERVKLGTSSVRQLVVRNPGKTHVDVTLEKLPSEEKGFVVDYTRFRLGGREETTLLVGWTPLKGGGVRDNIVVKFGNFRSQVTFIGNCIAPEEKLMSSFRAKKPLGPKNVNVSASAPRSGSGAAATAKGRTVPAKIVIPVNPVERKEISPPKRSIGEDPAASSRAVEVFQQRIPDTYQPSMSPTRRETFVR